MFRKARALALADARSCAAHDDGTVHCWGADPLSLDPLSLVARPNSHRLRPVAVPGLTNVVSVALGEHHSCTLDQAGRVRCWGANRAGQLGNGTVQASRWPTRVDGLANVVQLAAGTNHTCARLADGSVRCWGYNAQGQVGDGNPVFQLTPAVVPVVADLAAACVADATQAGD